MSDPDVELFNRNLMKALVADNDKMRAENARLRTVREAADEIARLYSEHAEMLVKLQEAKKYIDRLVAGAAPVVAEIDRLKAALRAIEPLTQTCYEAAEIARAALEGK